MCRRIMKTRPKHPEEDEELEEAIFVPEKGLVGSIFYHADINQHEEEDDSRPRNYEERPILFQAVDHDDKQLLHEPKLSKYFKEESDEANAKLPRTVRRLKRRQITKWRFRTRISKLFWRILALVSRLLFRVSIYASQIAIGDIFEIEGGLSPLKVEITCPRLCCAWVDKRQGSPFGLAGVNIFCNKNRLGGFFAWVLVAGELRDEMGFVPYLASASKGSGWTLACMSEALYGEGPKTYLMSSWAHWQCSKEELKELCKVEQLGRYEWKEEAECILK